MIAKEGEGWDKRVGIVVVVQVGEKEFWMGELGELWRDEVTR